MERFLDRFMVHRQQLEAHPRASEPLARINLEFGDAPATRTHEGRRTPDRKTEGIVRPTDVLVYREDPGALPVVIKERPIARIERVEAGAPLFDLSPDSGVRRSNSCLWMRTVPE